MGARESNQPKEVQGQTCCGKVPRWSFQVVVHGLKLREAVHSAMEEQLPEHTFRGHLCARGSPGCERGCFDGKWPSLLWNAVVEFHVPVHDIASMGKVVHALAGEELE